MNELIVSGSQCRVLIPTREQILQALMACLGQKHMADARQHLSPGDLATDLAAELTKIMTVQAQA